MTKGLTSLVLALAIIVAVGTLFNMRGPDMSLYQHLKDPAIRTMPPQRVLVVGAKGAPGTVGKKAFGLLFKTYFGVRGMPKGKSMPAPRARWPLSATESQSEWIGRYAMVIPDSIGAIPLPVFPDGLTVQVAIWEYGEVAEVLHLGPYDREGPVISRLHEFIEGRGYEIAGDHEEEYLRGPGILLKGNPEKYVTIIRYQIRKRETGTYTERHK